MRDWIPLAVALVALFSGVYGARASLRATRTNTETNQIKWLQDARADAATAKREAEAAKREADTALTEAHDARRDLTAMRREMEEQRDLTEEMTRWIIRVVDWARDDELPTHELRRLINGGPPSLRHQIGPRARDR